MARPRSFDVDEVLRASSAVFRRLGYEAASVDDLVRATGLHRGSLYGAFASKRGLFVAVLRAAVAPTTGAGDDDLGGGEDPVAGGVDRGATVPGDAVLDDDALDLVLVAALELAPRDAEVREVLAGACAGLEERGGGPVGVLGDRLLRRAGLTPLSPASASPTPTRSGRSN